MGFCHDNPILRSPAFARVGQFTRERRELLGEELARYDVTAEQIEVGGMRYRPVLTTPETYLTVAGPVTVTRYLYRPAGREHRSYLSVGGAGWPYRRLLDAVERGGQVSAWSSTC